MQLTKRRAERETKPKSAYQHTGHGALANQATGDIRQPVLGQMPASGHQLYAVGADEIRAVMTKELQHRPIRRSSAAEAFERLHAGIISPDSLTKDKAVQTTGLDGLVTR